MAAELIPGLNVGSVMNVFSGATYWISYGLFFIVTIVIGYAVMYYLKFKYSVIEFELVGSGTTSGLSVGRRKTNRFKWNKEKTSWISLFPLFNKNKIEPFDDKYIYAGKTIYAFKLGERYIPGCINISGKEDKKISAEINPVPHCIRNWELATFKEHEQEFQASGFWEQNKVFIMTIIAVTICAVMVVVVAYLSYKFAAGGRTDAQAITRAIEGLVQGNILK